MARPDPGTVSVRSREPVARTAAEFARGLPPYREVEIEVDTFDGLLVDYCRKKNARIILRGLRAVADFEYELQMANMNRHLNNDIVTTFIMANDAYFYVSSNLCKEVCRLGGDVSKLVPPPVDARLLAKLKPGK